MADVPRPPCPPRCKECELPYGVIAMRGHKPGCVIGSRQRQRDAEAAEVRSALADAVDARRQDVEFMDRLRDNIKKHGVLLDRLADA